jgi:hypothetical protein
MAHGVPRFVEWVAQDRIVAPAEWVCQVVRVFVRGNSFWQNNKRPFARINLATIQRKGAK